MRYKRVDKLFLRLWVLVMCVGLYNLHDFCQNKVWPKKVFSHHVVGVTFPMLQLVTSKDQLAAIIAHEIRRYKDEIFIVYIYSYIQWRT
jgi:hypothetical protein